MGFNSLLDFSDVFSLSGSDLVTLRFNTRLSLEWLVLLLGLAVNARHWIEIGLVVDWY